MGGQRDRRSPWAAPPFLVVPSDPARRQWASEVLRVYFDLGPAPDAARGDRHDGDGPCGPGYSGAMFERLGGGGDRAGVADRFVAEDLVAVTLLSVQVDQHAALRILGPDAEALSALLGQVPGDLDLVDAGDEHIGPGSPADELWRRVQRYDGLGETTTSKLLARKRPRLLPVIDSVVRDVLGIAWSGDYLRELRDYLRADPARWSFLTHARAGAGLDDEISVLRCLDVLLWMSRQPGCPTPTWNPTPDAAVSGSSDGAPSLNHSRGRGW